MSLRCPLCGGGLAWARSSADADDGWAECLDGFQVAVRVPGTETVPCLWAGGLILLDDQGPMAWMEGEPPVVLVRLVGQVDGVQ